MAKLKNCQICGKVFMAQGSEKICRSCQDAQAEIEAKVMQYVRDNPRCSIQDITDNTGATEALIRRLIEAGRFEQIGVDLPHPCKKCGKTILVGQFCEDCVAQMQANLQSVQGKILESATAAAARGKGMHSKDLKDSKK